MWRLTYCEGWGTRGPRVYHNWFFTRKPNKLECIFYVNRDHKRGATISWFDPCNSGLLSLSKIKTEF